MAAAVGSAVAIIPARLGSTRFPGKVLANQTGKYLIQHVWEAAGRAERVSRVVIATDDVRVRDAAASFGAEAVLTRPDHPNGTSRLSEAARLLALDPDHIIVNVQGDEPELEPGAIDGAVQSLVAGESAGWARIGTVAVPFGQGEDPRDPNCVKVVVGRGGRALYFSRSLIPYDRDGRHTVAPLRHVGLYAYRRRFLDEYAAMPQTPLEIVEQLEQLRALEHGHGIAVALCRSSRVGIDTPEQYAAFVERWKARH